MINLPRPIKAHGRHERHIRLPQQADPIQQRHGDRAQIDHRTHRSRPAANAIATPSSCVTSQGGAGLSNPTARARDDGRLCDRTVPCFILPINSGGVAQGATGAAPPNLTHKAAPHKSQSKIVTRQILGRPLTRRRRFKTAPLPNLAVLPPIEILPQRGVAHLRRRPVRLWTDACRRPSPDPPTAAMAPLPPIQDIRHTADITDEKTALFFNRRIRVIDAVQHEQAERVAGRKIRLSIRNPDARDVGPFPRPVPAVLAPVAHRIAPRI